MKTITYRTPDIASTRAGFARLTAKITRKDPTPAKKRFTIYHTLLFGGASSECWKICRRHEGGASIAKAPTVVPSVKKTYPVTKFELLNTIFWRTFQIPN